MLWPTWRSPNPNAFGLSSSLWVLFGLMFLGIFSIGYNFFAGGILGAWAGTRPFWAGCRHTFWAFTGLGALLLVLASIALVVAALLGGLLGAGGMLIVAAILLQLINLAGEYARALAVAQDRHNPFVLLGRAIGFARATPARWRWGCSACCCMAQCCCCCAPSLASSAGRLWRSSSSSWRC